LLLFFLLFLRPPPKFTLFPYTTLFRSPGVDDLVGRLPHLGEVAFDGSLVGKRVRGLPVDHRLVHPAPVEIRADRPLEVVDERVRSEEHTSELQSQSNLVCRLLLEKKKK